MKKEKLIYIGVIASSDGSAFKKSLEIINKCSVNSIKFVVITDRACGIENLISDNVIIKRIDYKDATDFSIKCKKAFDKFVQIDFILLFYTRLITKELFNSYPCLNIHPALLPAFKGLKSIQEAKEKKVRFLGCTLHMVNGFFDEGEIIAQLQMPICWTEELGSYKRYSYIQKVYLFLLIVDLFERKLLCFNDGGVMTVENLKYTDRCNPCLVNNKYLDEIILYQQELGADVIK